MRTRVITSQKALSSLTKACLLPIMQLLKMYNLKQLIQSLLSLTSLTLSLSKNKRSRKKKSLKSLLWVSNPYLSLTKRRSSLWTRICSITHSLWRTLSKSTLRMNSLSRMRPGLRLSLLAKDQTQWSKLTLWTLLKLWTFKRNSPRTWRNHQ